ncbi:hypothetical protein AH06_262 [Erwinia phage AH06]|nr:hypothetical protein AH06_262 [Erwinia phage AH06]
MAMRGNMYAEPVHVGYALITRPCDDEKVILTPVDSLVTAVRQQKYRDLIVGLVVSPGASDNVIDVNMHFLGRSMTAGVEDQVLLLSSFEPVDNEWIVHHVTGSMIDTFDAAAHTYIKSKLSEWTRQLSFEEA